MPAPLREVRFAHSPGFPELLSQWQSTLLISTYQAGKLVVLGRGHDGLSISLHNFEQAMGIAVSSQVWAVGTRSQVWFLHSAPDVARQLPGHDACFLTRTSHVTEDVQGHEMQWCGGELWLVNTRFSCLCTLETPYSFVPRWRPRFISQLAAEDRCHLNGLAADENGPRFVTALAETDTPQGWRPSKATAGCVIDVRNDQTLARGLAMPHSPRWFAERLWVLDSGRGELVTVDRSDGSRQTVSSQPGYLRGLCFAGPYAVVGLSKIRDTSAFGGVPLAEHRQHLKCGVAVVDLRTGRQVAHFEFLSGVTEIFDVQIVPQVSNPFVAGPFAHQEHGASFWYAPTPEQSAALSDAGASAARLRRAARGHAEANEFAQAIEGYRRALDAQPSAETYSDLGLVQYFAGDEAAARQSLRAALQLDPELPAAHMNLSMVLFRDGDLAAGWDEYEWRARSPTFRSRMPASPPGVEWWRGQPLAGKALRVYGEQGVGDEIMFATCFPELINQAGHVTLVCDPRLVPLFQRSFPGAACLDETARDERPYDYQILAGSIPRYLRRSLAAFPEGHCLQADSEAARAWRMRLESAAPGVWIGISWRGGRDAIERQRRSAELDWWDPIFSQRGAQFINLQYDSDVEEWDAVRRRFGDHVHHFDGVRPLEHLDDFAALLSALDLVISVDNSTLHLAGALGVPSWGLLSFPSASAWRWFGPHDACHWYRNVERIDRQQTTSWRMVIEQVATRLTEMVRSRTGQ